ncbi:MAG: zinc-ribbon domain-containing protein, partial [Propionibacteriaceae bacterium]|nr:zinc-ribbon domain-containing protein [Propionibacteriaceae bacterium]
MFFCPQCGTRVPAGAAFCPNCGFAMPKQTGETPPAQITEDVFIPDSEQPPATPAISEPSPADPAA